MNELKKIQEFWDERLKEEGFDKPLIELLLPIGVLEKIDAKRQIQDMSSSGIGKASFYNIMRRSLRDIDNLTKRARKILKLKAKQLTDDQIANAMGITTRGVQLSFARTKKKLLRKFNDRIKRFKPKD